MPDVQYSDVPLMAYSHTLHNSPITQNVHKFRGLQQFGKHIKKKREGKKFKGTHQNINDDFKTEN